MTDFIALPIVNFFSQYINRIIVGLFLINVVIFFIIMARTKAIKRIIDETRRPETARLEPDRAGETYLEKLTRTYEEWSARYRDINPWLQYYSILTSIFPLLGILGTVCGLLQVQADFSEVKGGFMLALSSTFWGLVAAIISKAGEGLFAADVDRFTVLYEVFTKDIIKIEERLRQKKPAEEEKDA
ncbi:MAG: MotA/TolQ/ExbB proton channel family protein [Thermodesulfobacteriota bacterium]